MTMPALLTHDLSPLAQARRAAGAGAVQLDHPSPVGAAPDAPGSPVAVTGGPLSDRDQATLAAVLADRCDFVPDPAFTQDDAERKLFDDAPPVPVADTAWYHPVMDDLSAATRAARGGAVLLTARQERTLFLQFNYARYRVRQLRDQLADADRVALPRARELLRWHARAEQLRAQIANTNLALVLAMAKRSRMSEVDFADMVSEGNMALLRAVDKFDASRGFKFSTYACRAILKAFSRQGVKSSKYRQMFPTDFDPKLERSDYQQRRRAEHEDDCADEVRRIIDSNAADLTDIEQEVLTHRFGVARGPAARPVVVTPAPTSPQPRSSRPREGPDAPPLPLAAAATTPARGTPLTLEEVGRIIGVTKERVRQIQNKALEKIRLTLESQYLR